MNFKHPLASRRRPAGRSFVGAFTLVELLVVIGIIALLISILLPSLGAARQASQRTACAAKLQQIMLAAQLHAIDHKGFYPLAGNLQGDGNLFTPAALFDADATRYDYSTYNPGAAEPRVLVPITFALGTEMSYSRNLAATAISTEITADTDQSGVIKHFLCPSQAGSVTDIQSNISASASPPMLYIGNVAGGYIYYMQSQSYVYNEGVLGFNDAYYRLRGQQIRVRMSAQTMFAADGNPGLNTDYISGLGMMTFFNKNTTGTPVTLADALTGRRVRGQPQAGDAVSFDRIRHKNKINIAYCDGHVETKDIPNLTSDPLAKGLATTYLLPPMN